VHPEIFSGVTLTFENRDEHDHHQINTADGHEVYLESTEDYAYRPWYPGLSNVFSLQHDPGTGKPIKDPNASDRHLGIPVDEDVQIQFATFANRTRRFHQFSKALKDRDRVRGEGVLRAIKDQHRHHKLSKSGNSPEITIDDNHALAPTAHVITTGAPKERFIFTLDAPLSLWMPVTSTHRNQIERHPIDQRPRRSWGDV
jgi:hypothetical protein